MKRFCIALEKTVSLELFAAFTVLKWESIVLEVYALDEVLAVKVK